LFYLEGLQVDGFRNYQSQKVRFNPHLNILVGANAQGKTNILESIFYLSVNRSFRTNRDQDLINWESGYFFIKGNFVRDDFKNTVTAGYKKQGPLKINVNNSPAKKYGHMQYYPVVAFSPDDLQIIKEGPSIRRRFINLEASRLSTNYLQNLKDYQRILRQRNKILKENHVRAKLERIIEPWDRALVIKGAALIEERKKIIRALEEKVQFFFGKMTSSMENISLQYKSSVKDVDILELMQEGFMDDLKTKRDQEMRMGSTLLGPHRDDIKIYINGYDSRSYSSQGQKRTAALALKMAEISLFYDRNRIHPIILLDDVFSEFDESRKLNLLDFIRNNGGQCFITSAVNQDPLLHKLNRPYKMFTISHGSVINEESRTTN